MSLWKKLFGSGVETVPSTPNEAAAVSATAQPVSPGPTGRANDPLAEARALADQNRWSEALAAVEGYLLFPQNDDIETARKRLRELLQVQSPSGQSAAATPAPPNKEDASVITSAMALRSKSLANLMKIMARARGATDMSSPEFASLSRKASAQVQLVTELFGSDPENLAWAAGLCHALGDHQQMRELLQRIAQVSPDNATAAIMLKLVAKRMAEPSDK